MFTAAQAVRYQEIVLRTIEWRQIPRTKRTPTRAERDRDELCNLLEVAIEAWRRAMQLELPFDEESVR